MKQKLYNRFNKKGFTLIELLVVIGILAVLAAIAIPAVAGLIDRANVAHDNTNANEMTNALERFASEYELYKQDVSCGIVKEGELDTMQGRVFNVTGTTTRDGLGALEGSTYDKNTFYPLTRDEARQVIETYVKTSSSTFDPKQSDKCFWYSPECGLVVVGDSDATAVKLNELVISGKDASGNDLTPSTQWIDLTCGDEADAGNSGSDNGDVTPDRDWRNDPYQSNRANDYVYINGVAYAFEITPVSPEDEWAQGQVNYHFENGLNPQGIDYIVKLHTVSGSVVDLTAEEQEMLASGNPFIVNGDHIELAFAPYGTKNSSGTQKFVPANGINTICGCETVCNGVYNGEPLVAQNTYDLTNAEYDEATENIVFTFSNGIKVLSPAAYSNYGRPYIQIDGQWYRWDYNDSFWSAGDIVNIKSVEPLTAVNQSAIDSFYYNQQQLAVVVETSLDGTHNGAYGLFNITYPGNDYKNIGSASTAEIYYVDIIDVSEVSQEVLDMIGGDLNSISMTNMFGYKKDGHTNSCIDMTTMSGAGFSLRGCASTYDEATDTTTLVFSNSTNANINTMRIRNASNRANAIFELKVNGNWVAVFKGAM